jgi:hypothetical protein
VCLQKNWSRLAFSSFSSSSWHSWDDVYKPFNSRHEGARAAGHQIPELKGTTGGRAITPERQMLKKTARRAFVGARTDYLRCEPARAVASVHRDRPRAGSDPALRSTKVLFRQRHPVRGPCRQNVVIEDVLWVVHHWRVPVPE